MLFLSLIMVTYAQQTAATEVRALAKFVSYEGGNKIHFSRYKIIRDFSNTIDADTINVEYYFYKMNDVNADTVLLTVSKKSGPAGNYICPDYDARLGIQQARVSYISREYRDNCEMRRGISEPLCCPRDTNAGHWFLLIPCGRTPATIFISKEGNPAFRKNISPAPGDCPFYLGLTGWEDGKYFADMLVYGFGGRMEFHLATKPVVPEK